MISRGIAKKITKFFVLSMSLLGTCAIVAALSIYVIVGPVKKEKSPEPFPNGFNYIDNPGVYGGKMITDKNGNIIVPESIDFLKWSGNAVYGRRLGLATFDRHYFICEVDKDCSKNQDYNEEEIEKILKEKNLPPLFTPYRPRKSFDPRGLGQQVDD